PMPPIHTLIKTLMEPGRLTLDDIDALGDRDLRLLANALEHWHQICRLHLDRRRQMGRQEQSATHTTNPEFS
ncbi:MAG: hypothetical protein ACLFQ1_11760, partial [Halochromatium sp.]|uniref:hypothetical protein n=1 Tax=Halochromatium sp. TaxID=2049430 RepID=UPI00397DCDD6